MSKWQFDVELHQGVHLFGTGGKGGKTRVNSVSHAHALKVVGVQVPVGGRKADAIEEFEEGRGTALGHPHVQHRKREEGNCPMGVFVGSSGRVHSALFFEGTFYQAGGLCFVRNETGWSFVSQLHLGLENGFVPRRRAAFFFKPTDWLVNHTVVKHYILQQSSIQKQN